MVDSDSAEAGGNGSQCGDRRRPHDRDRELAALLGLMLGLSGVFSWFFLFFSLFFLF
jgi:hypothetical protein